MLPHGRKAGPVSAGGIGGSGGIDAGAAGGAGTERRKDGMLEPGILFWTDRDDLATIRAFGVKMGQMGVPGGMTLDEDTAAQWKRALEEAAIKIVTLVAAYEGEDYADVPTVQRTVGFMPQGTRKARETR